jgi:uncharacterized RDD family membrane protein YckC
VRLAGYPMDGAPAFTADAIAVELYATWARRLGAWLIDGLMLLGADTALTLAVTHGGSRDAPLGWSLFYSAVLFLGPLAYCTLCHGSRAGQTLGKRAVAIAVRDRASLGRVSYARAFVRWLVTALFWMLLLLPGLLDGLWPLWDGKRQAWHDKIVGSVVIRL